MGLKFAHIIFLWTTSVGYIIRINTKTQFSNTWIGYWIQNKFLLDWISNGYIGWNEVISFRKFSSCVVFGTLCYRTSRAAHELNGNSWGILVFLTIILSLRSPENLCNRNWNREYYTVDKIACKFNCYASVFLADEHLHSVRLSLGSYHIWPHEYSW